MSKLDPKTRVLVANSLLTHAYKRCVKHGFGFDRIAPQHGLMKPGEESAPDNAGLLRALYRHCQNQDSKRVLHTKAPFDKAGWVDLSSPAAREILAGLTPYEGEIKDQYFQLSNNLGAQPWNSVLAIASPPIIFETKRRGGLIAGRFREDAPKPKGRHQVNEGLPPIPDPPNTPLNTVVTPSSQSECNNATPPKPSADEELQQGGFPRHRYHNENEESLGGKPCLNISAEESTQDCCDNGDNARPSNHKPDATPELEHAPISQPTCDSSDQHVLTAALANAGFPAEILTVDYEVYHSKDYNLEQRGMTAPLFVADPRFHAYGIAVRHPNGRTEFRRDVEACLAELKKQYGEELEKVVVAAHNALFDGYILADRYNVYPRYWLDTLGLARHVYPELPNALGDLAQRFGLPAKGNVLAQIKGHRNLSPQQDALLEQYAKNDVGLTYQVAVQMLPEFTRPGIELKILDHTIKLFTTRTLAFDIEEGEKLLKEINDGLQAKLEAAGIDDKTARSNKEFPALLADALAASGRELPMKEGKNAPIVALAKSDEPMQELANDADRKVKALARARLSAKGTPQWATRLAGMLRVAEVSGGIPAALKYCGAHTGRFTGAEGSLQNLPDSTKADDIGAAARLGTLIIPHPGHLFVGVDLGQIECRVLSWLAGQKDLLEAFGDSRDIYCEFASDIFGEEVRKPADSDAPDVARRLAGLRAIGKKAVLGLGYQMGHIRFEDTLRSDPEAARLIEEGVIDSGLCQQIVRQYRQRYVRIKKLWTQADEAFWDALDPGEGVARELRYRRVGADRVACELPSGRTMFYTNVNIDAASEIHFGRKGQKLYGGLLVENATQALARDIFVEMVLELEKRGLPVVLHVHDGAVIEVPEREADRALQTALEVFWTPPTWAPDLPLDAEGKICDRFGG